MNGKKFINHVVHLFRGQVVYAFAQWIVLAMLARVAGSAESGDYVLMLATTAPIFMLLDLNLRVVRSTDQQHNEQFRNYVALRFCCLVLAALISIAVCWWKFPDLLGVLVGMLLFRVGDSISNLSFGGLQRQHVADQIGISLFFKGVLSLVVLAIAVPVFRTAETAALAMGIISITWALFRDLPAAWRLNETDPTLSLWQLPSLMEPAAMLRIGKRALPMGIDAFASSLALNMPRYTIEAFFGRDALGVFGVLTQLAFSIQMLIGAVGHTGVSVLADRKKRNDRVAFWRLFNRMMLTSFAVGVLALIGGTLVLPTTVGWLLGPEHNRTLLMFLLLLASTIAGVQRMAGRAIQATGSYFIYTMMDVIIFGGSAITSCLVIEEHGLEGGGIALIVGFGTGLLVTLTYTYTMLWPEDAVVADEP